MGHRQELYLAAVDRAWVRGISDPGLSGQISGQARSGRSLTFRPFGHYHHRSEAIQVAESSRMRTIVVVLFGIMIRSIASAGEPPRIVRHVVVYAEGGRFAGWPANHGIWSWGDEILVGFSRGTYKDRGRFHHIDHDQPEEFLLARSRDGGATWSVEQPRPRGALVGTPGMRHGKMPRDATEERPTALEGPIDFARPGFAMTVRMENSNHGVSRYYFSYDRGTIWKGPYALPLFGQPGVMGRTDLIINGPADCLLFLTGSKPNGREGRPFCAGRPTAARPGVSFPTSGPSRPVMPSCRPRSGFRRPTW